MVQMLISGDAQLLVVDCKLAENVAQPDGLCEGVPFTSTANGTARASAETLGLT